MPLRSDWSGARCPIARSLDVVGDPWVLLIIREALGGTRRFADFKAALQIADSVLANRLQTLADAGLLTRLPYRADNRTHDEYVLTPAGADLLPVLQALLLWGEQHTPGPDERRLDIVHRDCGAVSSSADYCTGCGRPLTADNVDWLRPWRSAAPVPLVGAGAAAS